MNLINGVKIKDQLMCFEAPRPAAPNYSSCFMNIALVMSNKNGHVGFIL